jgi:hypothetical protein
MKEEGKQRKILHKEIES